MQQYVQNMHMDRNVNMVKPINLYIKESAKYMKNMSNVDYQKCNYSHDLERDVREKKNMDGVSMGKSFYGHRRQYETEHASPERGSQVEGRNRQGYQQGGPIYNIGYDRKPPHMIDNQLRQDTRINENMNR